MVTARYSLSDRDRSRVEAAIKEAETRTSAEIAVVIARASDRYAAYPLTWAGILALACGGSGVLLFPGLSAGSLFAVEAAVFAAAALFLQWEPLRLRLVPAVVKRRRARDLARLQFAALVDDQTAEENGLLLFVALGERHIEILADRGIARLVPEERWTEIVGGFLERVRDGRLAEGVIEAIRACSAALEGPFPPRRGSINEIPNRPVEL